MEMENFGTQQRRKTHVGLTAGQCEFSVHKDKGGNGKINGRKNERWKRKEKGKEKEHDPKGMRKYRYVIMESFFLNE
jgi:hypothetical protein